MKIDHVVQRIEGVDVLFALQPPVVLPDAIGHMALAGGIAAVLGAHAEYRRGHGTGQATESWSRVYRSVMSLGISQARALHTDPAQSVANALTQVTQGDPVITVR